MRQTLFAAHPTIEVIFSGELKMDANGEHNLQQNPNRQARSQQNLPVTTSIALKCNNWAKNTPLENRQHAYTPTAASAASAAKPYGFRFLVKSTIVTSGCAAALHSKNVSANTVFGVIDVTSIATSVPFL